MKYLYVVIYHGRNSIEQLGINADEEWVCRLLYEEDHFAATRKAEETLKATLPDYFKMWSEPQHIGKLEDLERIISSQGYLDLLWA